MSGISESWHDPRCNVGCTRSAGAPLINKPILGEEHHINSAIRFAESGAFAVDRASLEGTVKNKFGVRAPH